MSWCKANLSNVNDQSKPMDQCPTIITIDSVVSCYDNLGVLMDEAVVSALVDETLLAVIIRGLLGLDIESIFALVAHPVHLDISLSAVHRLQLRLVCSTASSRPAKSMTPEVFDADDGGSATGNNGNGRLNHTPVHGHCHGPAEIRVRQKRGQEGETNGRRNDGKESDQKCSHSKPLALGIHLQRLDDWNRQCIDHKICDDSSDGVSDVECGLVDAFSSKGRVEGQANRTALESGHQDIDDGIGKDNTSNDPHQDDKNLATDTQKDTSIQSEDRQFDTAKCCVISDGANVDSQLVVADSFAAFVPNHTSDMSTHTTFDGNENGDSKRKEGDDSNEIENIVQSNPAPRTRVIIVISKLQRVSSDAAKEEDDGDQSAANDDNNSSTRSSIIVVVIGSGTSLWRNDCCHGRHDC